MAANISLGQNGGVYAHRTISGAAQYMPDATTVLARSNIATVSDDWGTAALAGLNGTSNGFVFQPNQDINIQFVGNAGNAYLEYYDPVAANWLPWITITDAVGHVIRAPGFMPIRFNPNNAGTTAVKMWTQR